MKHTSHTIEYVRPSRMADVAVPHRIVVAAPSVPEPRVRAKGKGRAASFGSFFMAAFLAVGAFSLANASTTVSYFADTEESLGNILEAIGLDFILNDTSEMQLSVSAGEAGSTDIAPDVSFDVLSNDPVYRITIEQSQNQSVESNTAFCDALSGVSTSATLPYNGPLLGLTTGTTIIPGPWPLNISFVGNENISNGDVCKVDLVYRGWAQGSAEGTGYQDEERITLVITAIEAIEPLAIEELTTFTTFSLLAPEEETPEEDDTATTTEETEEETTPEEEPAARTGGGGGGEPAIVQEENTDTPTPPTPPESPESPTPPEQEEEPLAQEEPPAEEVIEETPPAEEEQTTEEIVEEIPPANDETEVTEVVEETTSEPEPEPEVEQVVDSTPPAESGEVTE